MADAAPAGDELVRTVRARLTLELDPAVANPFSTMPGRRELIRSAIENALGEVGAASDATLVDELYDELVGLGPLQPLMANPAITDILVNRHDEVYVERGGRLELAAARFRDQAHLEQVIAKIVALV